MLGLFRRWLEQLVQLGLDLAAALVRGIFGALLAPLTPRGRVSPAARRAQPEEVVDVRHRVLRAGRPREEAVWDGDLEPETRHWLVEADGRAIAVATVLKRPSAEGPGWQLRGMATDADWRGKGEGRRLLEAVVRDVGEPMWCNARSTAVPFYERAGWRVVGEPFEIAGIGPHRRMVRD